MSLILDALNRAENERKNHNAVPDLNTLHRPLEVSPSPNRSRTLWIVVGLVSVLLAIIVVLVTMLRRETTAPPAVAPQEPVQLSPVVPPAAAVLPSASEPEPEPQPETPVVQVQTKVATPQTVDADGDINKLYATEELGTAPSADTGVDELYAAEAATAATSETIVDPFNPAGTSPVVAGIAPEQTPPKTFDGIKNIPDFNALPWNMRQQIPTITYSRHNYLPNGLSSVVINNQTTGVGNIIGAGQFIVQDIYVDGVVLKHGNATFKLRALNGWINM